MASTFKLNCPHCDKSLKVSHSLAGKSRTCPYCQGTVKIPEQIFAETFNASCPDCGQVYEIAAEDEGTQGECDCGASFVLSRSAAAQQASPTPAVAAVATSPQIDIKSERRPSERARSLRNKSRPKQGWFGGGEETDSSNVSLILSALIGFIVSVVFLAMVYPLRQFQFGQIFWDRGWVPFATTFLAFWSGAILFLKWRKLKRQKNSMLLDVLPTEISNEITIDSLDRFVTHVNQLPRSSGDSYLINRVLRGIEHFRVRKSAAETVTMMESQSAIDANNVMGSYTLLKVFIWALPILGFIGTVIGVSAAVASLAGSLESAADISSVKDSLNDVFGGLGTAFDTTLLALILSMFVKIPTSALQKSEEDLITQVDEYCNENLLRRLNDGREGGAERGAGGGTNAFREAVEAAMGTHHAELENWLKKLDKIGGKLTAQVAEGWEEVNTKIQQQQQQHAMAMQKQQQRQAAVLHKNLEDMTLAAGTIQQRLADLTEQTEALQSGVTSTVSGSSQVLTEHFDGIQKGLTKLNQVLSDLGEQQIVVQQVETKRGWFGSRKRNSRRR